MLAYRRARLGALALVVLALGACTSPPAGTVAGPTGKGASLAPAAAGAPAALATSRPQAAPGATAPPRPADPAPVTALLGASAPPAPLAPAAAPARASGLLSEPVSPQGVPFLPPSVPASATPATPATPAATGGPAVAVTVRPVPAAPTETPAPAPAPALSVPFGLYVAGGYNGESTVYIAAMEMRSDGTYSMQTAAGEDIPDPTTGRSGAYRVVNGSALEFLTGPYAGTEAAVIPDYQGTGRDFIDLTFAGVFTSFHFERA